MQKPFEALGNWLLGEDSQEIPPLPQALPAELAQALDRHVRMLVEFQNTDYAELYLDRLGRFHERHGVEQQLEPLVRFERAGVHDHRR